MAWGSQTSESTPLFSSVTYTGPTGSLISPPPRSVGPPPLLLLSCFPSLFPLFPSSEAATDAAMSAAGDATTWWAASGPLCIVLRWVIRGINQSRSNSERNQSIEKEQGTYSINWETPSNEIQQLSSLKWTVMMPLKNQGSRLTCSRICTTRNPWPPTI